MSHRTVSDCHFNFGLHLLNFTFSCRVRMSPKCVIDLYLVKQKSLIVTHRKHSRKKEKMPIFFSGGISSL